MPPSILPLLFFLCFLHGSRAADDEIQILLDLKNSLGITTSTVGFESWTPSNSPCNFSGIHCDSKGSVSEINLDNRGISGTLPFSSICRLPSLSKLSVGSNNIYGKLTADLQNCTELQHLELAFNSLAGEVPDLSRLNKLQVLNLSDNGFYGSFPWSSLSNLTDLVTLSVADNPFEMSKFPEEILNLTKLYWIYLSNCSITGSIPPAIGNLTELYHLELSDNFISGEFPPEITKLKKLWMLEIYNNSLTGKFPPGFGNLSDLAYFDASMNNLEGDLSELRFLTKLVSLQLLFNNFAGEIPPEFGDFKYLVNLSLYNNRLSGPLPQKLGSWTEFNFIDVSTNYFTGPIPPDMCQKGTMKRLLMLENMFSGEIPATYGNCSSLVRFRVNNNSLSGEVPAGIWSLPNVNIIDLSINQFEGRVTAGIGQAKALSQLYIANNQFSGELPMDITEAVSLAQIDIRSNQFTGEIPANMGTLKQLLSLHLEKNKLSGEIPDSLGSCSSLNEVNLAGNSLSGQIPASLGMLPALNSLDLSDNQLSGGIPGSLSSLKLSLLDLSNNRLTGQVPQSLSIDAYNGSFVGNPGLCSENILYLRRCLSDSGGFSDKVRTVISCIFAGFAFLLAALGCFLFLRKRRSDVRDRSMLKNSWDMKSFRILSFDEQEIINLIKQENLIGKGGSGNVYGVELGNGKMFAVKHIWNSVDPVTGGGEGKEGSRNRSTAPMLTRRSSSIRSREFDAEVTTLSSIRHVNVVKLYCSITSEDSNLLVYEYLPNGSLWDRLHTCTVEKLWLDWDTRYEIAVGAAKGLEYLHHGCDRPILHRDVKSSNILLDESLKPRIADFGLAKILQSAAAGKDSSHVIAGTHGYIAPEYAYTWKVNEKSDVYSFGVVLMELVTGKRPIEPEFGENKDIVYWVSGRMTSRESVFGSVDARIPYSSREDAVKVLRVGVLCTARLPALRPSMRTVVQMLEEIGGFRFTIEVDAKTQKLDGGFTCEAKEEKVKLSP